MNSYPKIVLVGYRGSQKIVPASKYLTDKYLPMFDKIYLNYTDGINGWGNYVASFLKYLPDETVIFALDDYLVSGEIDMDNFKKALREIEDSPNIACSKLCYCRDDENEEYPITTQYTLWRKEALIELLEKTYDPWRFEVNGSRDFQGIMIHRPCIPYFTNSSISARWEGVRLDGLTIEDQQYLKKQHVKSLMNEK